MRYWQTTLTLTFNFKTILHVRTIKTVHFQYTVLIQSLKIERKGFHQNIREIYKLRDSTKILYSAWLNIYIISCPFVTFRQQRGYSAYIYFLFVDTDKISSM